jgi:CBS-domain-containing membrane protein
MIETHLALYRKYRPQSFDDVVGQEQLVTLLTSSIKQKKTAHAYLFCGGRGTGKTTVARIFARDIGCNPEDIIEIDAASNRGIDEIRELREAVRTAPFSSPYKVYIVDEAHMLTKEAANALLKTLEHEKEAELRELMKLSETPVGHYMTTEFLTVSRDDVASLILRRIPSETDHMDFLDYVYVVNSKNQLIGVFNMHELLTQKKDTPVYKFMTADVIVAHLNSPLKLVFRKLIKYKISALPIVDVKKRILGIVTVDDIGEVFVENL